MTLSKAQRERPSHKDWHYIWERDLLMLAKRHSAWRELAHDLGFTDEKINSPWTHADAGRHIPYMPIAKPKLVSFHYDEATRTLDVKRI